MEGGERQTIIWETKERSITDPKFPFFWKFDSAWNSKSCTEFKTTQSNDFLKLYIERLMVYSIFDWSFILVLKTHKNKTENSLSGLKTKKLKSWNDTERALANKPMVFTMPLKQVR